MNEMLHQWQSWRFLMKTNVLGYPWNAITVNLYMASKWMRRTTLFSGFLSFVCFFWYVNLSIILKNTKTSSLLVFDSVCCSNNYWPNWCFTWRILYRSKTPSTDHLWCLIRFYDTHDLRQMWYWQKTVYRLSDFLINWHTHAVILCSF